MKLLILRSVAFLLLSFSVIHIQGKRDSLLWVGIRDAGICFQQGQIDSAWMMSCRLMAMASHQEDVLAVAQLHSLMGYCLKEQNRQLDAVEEFRKCVEIGENNRFLSKAVKARHTLYVTVMLPCYAELAGYYKGNRGADYARRGMAWIDSLPISRLTVAPMSVFADVLMTQRDYGLIYEPMKQVAAEALRQQMPDFALQMFAYLARIEHQEFHRQSQDIPWIEAGERLLPAVRTEAVRTLFLRVARLEMGKGPALPVMAADSDRANASAPVELPREEGKVPSTKGKPMPSKAKSDYEQNRYGITLVVIVVALIVLLVLLAAYIFRQRRVRQQRLVNSYLEGKEEERMRLARELHDGVGNQLLAVQMKLNVEGSTEQAIRLLNESREQVRRVSHELMPPEFANAALDEIVAHYVESLDGASPCEVCFFKTPPDADWSGLSDQQALEIYRIVQEAVGNALKHSRATLVSVGLLKTGTRAEIVVSDNGSFKADVSEPGIGLRTMQQRAKMIGAVLTYQRSEYGNVVKLTL